MRRFMELLFPKSGTRAVAEVLDDLAPMTCEAIWTVLEQPVQRTVIHAAFSGQNVLFYNLPRISDPDRLPLENHRVRTKPGEIMFFYMPAGRLAGMDSIAEWLHPSGEILEMVFSYGESDLMGAAIGGWRGSHWATIVENLEGFAHACHRMRTEGSQDIVLRRSS